MPLTTDDRQFLKFVYRQLEDRPLDPGDPRYQPPYDHPGCEDPIRLLQNDIEYADSESLNLFSGFRGSGKTTELFRLRQRLTEAGYVVLYADALQYINPATPIEIAGLFIVLAGAFGDALEQEHRIRLKDETYWDRFRNWLTTTDVNLKEIGRLTRFLDTLLVLYLRNGEEWYDLHPLVRDEVQKIAKSSRAATAE
ncbi:MAG: ATP-binding protein [Acidobacteriia bacterium]|nr:ATP-binding protein [Terriglobia bacterium]